MLTHTDNLIMLFNIQDFTDLFLP